MLNPLGNEERELPEQVLCFLPGGSRNEACGSGWGIKGGDSSSKSWRLQPESWPSFVGHTPSPAVRNSSTAAPGFPQASDQQRGLRVPSDRWQGPSRYQCIVLDRCTHTHTYTHTFALANWTRPSNWEGVCSTCDRQQSSDLFGQLVVSQSGSNEPSILLQGLDAEREDILTFVHL